LNRHGIYTCVFLIALYGAVPAQADIVWMNNGDRISGVIRSLDHDGLLLMLPGDVHLVIAWRDVRTLRSARRLIVTRQEAGENITSRLHEAADGKVLLDDQRELALADVLSLAAPVRRSRDYKWNGNLDLELESERESSEDKDRVKAKIDTRLQVESWRNHVEGESEYEQHDDETSQDRYKLGYALDRLFEPNWLWRVHGRYERDAIDDLWMTRELGSGPGFRLKGDTLGRFELVLEWIVKNFRQQTPSYDPPARLSTDLDVESIGLSWDWKRNLFAESLELFTTGTLYVPHSISAGIHVHGDNGEQLSTTIDVDIDSIVDGELGLRYRFNQNINIAFRMEYDRTTGGDLNQADRRTFFSIGYEW